MDEAKQIMEARAARRWSQARLAEEAKLLLPAAERGGMKQQVVDRVEKGGDSRYKNAIRAALDLPPSLVVARVEDASVELDVDAPSFKSQAGRTRDVAEMGVAVGGSEGDFTLNGEVIGRAPRPAPLIGREIFAVRVKGLSMEPRFFEGDLLYVESHREPRPGEDVIVELNSENDNTPAHAFIKRLVSKNNTNVTVEQYNPPKMINFSRDRIKRLYRVIPTNEVLGV